MPKDFKVTKISRTVGIDQVVDELVISFTHNTEIEYLLPGVAPTGKYVEILHVVIMKFKNNKISHEHIYWDQASVFADRPSQSRKYTNIRDRTNKKVSRTIKEELK
jgi:carboxymethylenebutenolidase